MPRPLRLRPSKRIGENLYNGTGRNGDTTHMPTARTSPFPLRRAVLKTIVCCTTILPIAAGGAEPPKSPVKIVFLDQVTKIEAQVATLLQRHSEAAGPELPLLDLQIDLRLVERWMLAKAAEAPPDSPLPAAVALRVATLDSAGKAISRRLQVSLNALTPLQLDGLSKLHQLTYKLPEIKDVGVLDDVCKAVGTDLILAANTLPAEAKNMPSMRPAPVPETSHPDAAAAPRTLAELSTQATAAKVSPALKRELTALAAAATSAANDPKAQEDAAALYEMLSAADDLADGIEHGTGLDPVSRGKIEQQLVEGLALFTDVRTRPIGRGRLDTLGRYRATLARVQRLGVPPALREKLAPTFVWVQQNPDKGGHVLEAVENYLGQCARADARKEAAPLPPAQRKTVDGMLRQFATHRAGFLEDAADLGGSGILSTGPANLTTHVDAMRQLLDSVEGIERLPRAIQTLALYKPKPAGGMDKRAQAAVADMGSPIPSAGKETSARFIADVEQVAQLADTMAKPPAGIPPAVLKAFTHDRLAAVDARKNAMIGGLSSQLAAGKEPDRLDISKLQTLKAMLDSLQEAAEVHAALSQAEVLTRWVDWSIGAEQFGALLAPYEEATAGAFDGLADDNITPVSRWPEARKRYAPLIALAKEVGQYATPCAAFPSGLPGDLARLLTPINNQPFALERNASLAVGIWQRYSETADQRSADALFESMLAKLRKDLQLPE
ncbi:MAG: hypothetical protein JWP03_274 [Phycisphaerales bacterium]|nr:hypothetical protein [Phycisphaerales bacterium]